MRAEPGNISRSNSLLFFSLFGLLLFSLSYRLSVLSLLLLQQLYPILPFCDLLAQIFVIGSDFSGLKGILPPE